MTIIASRFEKSYLALYSLLHERSWRGAGSLAVLVLIICGLVGSLIYWTDWQSQPRNFLLCYLGLVIVLTCLAAYEKRSELSRKNDALFAAKMKFRAEIWAGCAILAFAGQFSQLGATFESEYTGHRAKLLESVSQQIHSASGCPTPASTPNCKVLERELNQLPQYVKLKPDSMLTLTIASLKATLQDLRGSGLASDAFKQLDEFNRRDVISILLQPLPVLTLMFASLAISSKIGLAWNDHRKEAVKADQPKKPDPAALAEAAANAALVSAKAAVASAARASESMSAVKLILAQTTSAFVSPKLRLANRHGIKSHWHSRALRRRKQGT